MINSNLWFLIFMLSIGTVTWFVELIKYLKERKVKKCGRFTLPEN